VLDTGGGAVTGFACPECLAPLPGLVAYCPTCGEVLNRSVGADPVGADKAPGVSGGGAAGPAADPPWTPNPRHPLAMPPPAAYAATSGDSTTREGKDMQTGPTAQEAFLEEAVVARRRVLTEAREIRTRLDVSLDAAGAAVGVSPSTISRWERGAGRIPLHLAVAYMAVLDRIDAAGR